MKILTTIFLCFLIAGCTAKVEPRPDPLAGRLSVPADLEEQISKEAKGDCETENLIKQQLNFKFFTICQMVCAESYDKDTFAFHLHELAECVAHCMTLHGLPKTPCEKE